MTIARGVTQTPAVVQQQSCSGGAVGGARSSATPKTRALVLGGRAHGRWLDPADCGDKLEIACDEPPRSLRTTHAPAAAAKAVYRRVTVSVAGSKQWTVFVPADLRRDRELAFVLDSLFGIAKEAKRER